MVLVNVSDVILLDECMFCLFGLIEIRFVLMVLMCFSICCLFFLLMVIMVIIVVILIIIFKSVSKVLN